MAKTSEFGKAVKIRLIQLDQTQGWLIEQVKEKTGLYFDSAYLSRVLSGKSKTPSIVEAIRDILCLPEGTENSE